MSKHTTGLIFNSDENTIHDATGVTVGAAYDLRRDTTGEEAEANARLWTASPKLLAACQSVASGIGNLPLEELGPSGVHGINDGKQRAIYLEAFVRICRDAIAELD